MIFKGKEKIYRIFLLSVFLIIVLSIIEMLIRYKEVHFFVEKIPSFYGFLGFFSAIVIILITSIMKRLGLKKNENYYD